MEDIRSFREEFLKQNGHAKSVVVKDARNVTIQENYMKSRLKNLSLRKP